MKKGLFLGMASSSSLSSYQGAAAAGLYKARERRDDRRAYEAIKDIGLETPQATRFEKRHGRRRCAQAGTKQFSTLSAINHSQRR
jgi:hypothetical protein